MKEVAARPAQVTGTLPEQAAPDEPRRWPGIAQAGVKTDKAMGDQIAGSSSR